ncbi:rhodanese-like domain-containing protein [Nesterenkonia sp. LB17]|uniref:rhodanese-like domain-containing protein n=1 Tax=unclassified Nesterenkonia TaxID=2629769 RepID=UPI001F4D202A|nr:MULTISPECIES: rhodanese-like domain-containing protein [unclassified Nesterenkonia]MCH8559701.1 rhodanese-like domain-containing protein [Nesterenkonia sp. DZ6]MCH8561865.1 rhodanese-like domain-containing protein [Nesterenkonia sp. YGD6]MCH8564598.1 rhodanese-like domain-containing protein [Nesterenkonia sp. LB17]MCH8570224.1 rhodanese-like domain-containing protein [Nesterenkonia sp. AY15]
MANTTTSTLNPTTTAAASPMSPTELVEKLRSQNAPLLVDVRTPAEHESLRVPGSHNVPLDLLQKNKETLAEQFNGDIVLICQTGNRANQALQHLRAAGVDTARVLEGGVVAMEAQHSQHTHRGQQRWAMDRQVRMVAGSLVLAGFLGGKLISPKVGYVAGAIGAGLTFSAATDSCAMAAALNKMPWNKVEADPTVEAFLAQIPRSTQIQTPASRG